MKTLINIAAVAILFLTACTSVNQLSSAYDDDGVYTSKKAKAVVQNQPAEVKQNTANQPSTNYIETTPKSYNSTEQSADKSKQSYEKYKQAQAENASQIVYDTNPKPMEETAVVTDNNQNYSGYDADDYYDYGYSSRIRRFHNPCHCFSYYDDYYTNMYWYNHDPFYYGTSIYMGYNWWGPSYSFYNPYYYNNWGWNIGFGYGWGIGMVYSDWYSPYWGGYYGYGGYGWGHGYNDGYWASDYYNSNSNSHFYGPRNFIGSSNGSGHRATSSASNSGGKKEPEIQPVSSPLSRSGSVNSNNQTNTTSSERKDVVKPSDTRLTEPAAANARTTDSKVVTSEPNKVVSTVTGTDNKRVETDNVRRVETPNSSTRNYSTPAARINNYQRYSRSSQEQKTVTPANTTTSPNTYNYRDPKSYSSPNYTQPRSSQEFEAPKYKSERNYNNRPAQTQPANTQETPRQYNNYNNRSYTPPANTENRNTSTPASNDRQNYTPPSTNYSSPAPSRSTYTAPPSNSGGSNSGSRSGGNSGGGNNHRR